MDHDDHYHDSDNENGNGRVKFKLADVRTLASIQEAFRYLKQDLEEEKRRREKLQSDVEESHRIFNDLRYEMRLELDGLKEDIDDELAVLVKEQIAPLRDGYMSKWLTYVLMALIGIVGVETTFIFQHILSGG